MKVGPVLMGVRVMIDALGVNDAGLIALAVRLAQDIDEMEIGSDTSKLATQLRLTIADLRAQVSPEDAMDDPFAELLTNVRKHGK